MNDTNTPQRQDETKEQQEIHTEVMCLVFYFSERIFLFKGPEVEGKTMEKFT